MDVWTAFERLMALASPLGHEVVPAVAAAGRTAAAAVSAPCAAPGFARAMMDGYICHADDIAAAGRDQPVTLAVTGRVRMGEVPQAGPQRGEAWTITTGGPMPPIGDVVVPQEATSVAGDFVSVRRPLPAGRNVAPPGNDVQLGEALVRAGEMIAPALTAALVAAGTAELPVYRVPRVLILATGDEVDDHSERSGAPCAPGRIRNSNAVYLGAELRTLGMTTEYGGVVPDEPDAVQRAFAAALARHDCDVILTTGGVSVGPHDYVPAAWMAVGVERVVGRLSIKPGGPLFIGRHGAKWVVSLSGNPPACMTAYQLLVRPLLLRLMGRQQCVRPITPVRLATPYGKAATGLRALWARVAGAEATLTSGTDAGRLVAMARSNAIVFMPAGTPALGGGETLAALRLDQLEDRTELAIPGRPAAPVGSPVG
jgi:molybdopterin molybdotransferase